MLPLAPITKIIAASSFFLCADRVFIGGYCSYEWSIQFSVTVFRGSLHNKVSRPQATQTGNSCLPGLPERHFLRPERGDGVRIVGSRAGTEAAAKQKIEGQTEKSIVEGGEADASRPVSDMCSWTEDKEDPRPARFRR